MKLRNLLIMHNSLKNLRDITEGDIVALTNKDHAIQDFVAVKEVLDIGFIASSSQRTNLFVRWNGEAPGTKLFARPATEQETLIYKVKHISANAWVAIGMTKLQEIAQMLKITPK